jgi:hypothetical protein
MYKIVYKLPNDNHYAFVSRSGSSSIALMAMNYCNHELSDMYNKFYDYNSHLISPHRLMEYIICEKMPPQTIVVVRNPIERLQSLVHRTGINIKTALAGLYWVYNIGQKPKHTERESLDRLSGDALYHFRPVSTIVENDSKTIPFELIGEIPNILGLNVVLPHVNKNTNEKEQFSDEVLEDIYSAYGSDIKLWKSLKF